MAEKFFRLPEKYRQRLLRDNGHFPGDFHPDAHFKGELPFQPHEFRSGIQTKPDTSTNLNLNPTR